MSKSKAFCWTSLAAVVGTGLGAVGGYANYALSCNDGNWSWDSNSELFRGCVLAGAAIGLVVSAFGIVAGKYLPPLCASKSSQNDYALFSGKNTGSAAGLDDLEAQPINRATPKL
jgi:hypothetical protein